MLMANNIFSGFKPGSEALFKIPFDFDRIWDIVIQFTVNQEIMKGKYFALLIVFSTEAFFVISPLRSGSHNIYLAPSRGHIWLQECHRCE